MSRVTSGLIAAVLVAAGGLWLWSSAQAHCGSCPGDKAKAEAGKEHADGPACPAGAKSCPMAAKQMAEKHEHEACPPDCTMPCCADKVASPAVVGRPVPAFTLADQAGKPVSLADYKGKVVVLEWANWACPFIKRHYAAGTTNRLADEYRDKGVVWLTINSTKGSSADDNAKGVAQYKLNHPVLDDHAGAVGRAYGAKSTPHCFVIDKAGKLAYSGGLDDDPTGRKSERVNYVADALAALAAGQPVKVAHSKPYGCTVKYAPAAKMADTPAAPTTQPDSAATAMSGAPVSAASMAEPCAPGCEPACPPACTDGCCEDAAAGE